MKQKEKVLADGLAFIYAQAYAATVRWYGHEDAIEYAKDAVQSYKKIQASGEKE